MGPIHNLLLGVAIMGLTHTFCAESTLFDTYPALRSSIAYVRLGQFPTPIARLQTAQKYVGLSQLYIKREDLAGTLFGGNKIRKLEFLLADALKKNYKTVLAYGGIASNNVTSVAAYSKQVGLKSIALLMDQPITRNLKRNLLLDQYYGCTLFACPHDRELTADELTAFIKEHALDPNPYMIPMGGSNKIGIIGWVNAAFELKEQIEQGIIAEPDYIYITLGSLGTTAGLLLGIKAAGLKTKVKAIQATNPEKYNKTKLCNLIKETNQLLHDADPSFALFEWNAQEFDINTHYLGNGYACKTLEGELARAFFMNLEDIILDETYTAKTVAALIADCRSGVVKPADVVLYWHTYCSNPYSDLINEIDEGFLPQEFQKYLTPLNHSS
jgi:D-cysteine desulfhydrase